MGREVWAQVTNCRRFVFTGVGVRISRAVIQGCSDCGVPISEDEDFRKAEQNGARLYKVWGTDRCSLQPTSSGTFRGCYYSIMFEPSATSGKEGQALLMDSGDDQFFEEQSMIWYGCCSSVFWSRVPTLKKSDRHC